MLLCVDRYLLLKQIVWGIGGIGENETFVDKCMGNGVVVFVVLHRPNSSSAILALSCTFNFFTSTLFTQVVAGLNYKLTLAIVEGGENTTNNNSNNNNILCRGFIRGITIYKPLPHTGLGLSVSSWGKPMDCNSADKELLDLLHDATMMDEDDEDDGKENALVVEDALEEEWEEVEPDT